MQLEKKTYIPTSTYLIRLFPSRADGHFYRRVCDRAARMANAKTAISVKFPLMRVCSRRICTTI